MRRCPTVVRIEVADRSGQPPADAGADRWGSALRAIAELAALGTAPDAGSWVKTESMSNTQDIPLPFLLNIRAELRTVGLVRSHSASHLLG